MEFDPEIEALCQLPDHYRYEIHDIEVPTSYRFEYLVEVRLHTYKAVAETPKGYWLSYYGQGKDHWVSKDSMKRWAYPSKAEALRNFLRRKRKYVKILKNQLKRTEAAIPLAEEILDAL